MTQTAPNTLSIGDVRVLNEGDENVAAHPFQARFQALKSRMKLNTSSQARVQPKTKILILSVGLFLILAVVLTSILIYFLHTLPNRICREEKKIHIPSVNCTDDGFSEIEYLFNSTCIEGTTKRYLKYKLVDDEETAQFYNYSSAEEECKRLNSSMWEVIDGESEWQVVIDTIKKLSRANVWINANVLENCPNTPIATGDNDEFNYTTCKHKEAIKGNGLRVEWPSAKYMTSTYSRLIRGSNSNVGNACVFVDTNNEDVWDVHDCAAPRYWGLCIKRNCFPEDDNI